MSNVEETSKSLYKAMKGFGTDESRLIREIVLHTNSSRVSLYLLVFIRLLLYTLMLSMHVLYISTLKDRNMHQT
jgi:hypothetical protein